MLARQPDNSFSHLKYPYGRGTVTNPILQLPRKHESNVRRFYLTYKERISEPVFRLFAIEKSEPVVSLFRDKPPFTLPWTHYLILMRIKNPDERNFYEMEATKGTWSKRVLQRQYSSSLYERLLLSSDKNKVMELSTQGLVVKTRLLNHLQEFIMELGTGFTFSARQKRLVFDEDTFYCDLVMYNRLLRCFVLFELKVKKLTT